MSAHDLTITVRGGSAEEKPAAFAPSGTPRRLATSTSVLFGTLLGPALVVTGERTQSDTDKAHGATSTRANSQLDALRPSRALT
jgi:hypothetical protein